MSSANSKSVSRKLTSKMCNARAESPGFCSPLTQAPSGCTQAITCREGEGVKIRFSGRRRTCEAPSSFSDPPLLISSVLGRAAASCLDPPLLLPALFPPPPSLSLLLLSAFAREHQREPGSRVTRQPDMRHTLDKIILGRESRRQKQ